MHGRPKLDVQIYRIGLLIEFELNTLLFLTTIDDITKAESFIDNFLIILLIWVFQKLRLLAIGQRLNLSFLKLTHMNYHFFNNKHKRKTTESTFIDTFPASGRADTYVNKSFTCCEK